MRDHAFFMRQVLELACSCKSLVSPNPYVAALLVQNDRVSAIGCHRYFGGPHAEVELFDSLKNKSDSIGGTLYCNLEPCCYEGDGKKTPPCVPLIILQKIKRVVISNLDPNPKVSGRGILELRSANIEVITGILEKEGREVNKIFFHYIKKKIPYIHIKAAQTLDGKIADSFFSSRWISSTLARKEVHLLRLKYDAILIGIGTLRKDNPLLTIRMGVKDAGKISYKIILGKPCMADFTCSLFSHSPDNKIIFCWKKEKEFFKMKRVLDKRKILFIEFDNLLELVQKLGAINISSLLIEGGSQTLSSFIDENLFNKLSLYISPTLLGSGLPCYDSKEIRSLDKKICFDRSQFRLLGDHIVFEGEQCSQE